MKSRKMLNNIVEGEKHLLGGMSTQELRHLLGDKLPILNFIIKAAHELLQNKNEKRNDKVKLIYQTSSSSPNHTKMSRSDPGNARELSEEP